MYVVKRIMQGNVVLSIDCFVFVFQFNQFVMKDDLVSRFNIDTNDDILISVILYDVIKEKKLKHTLIIYD